MAELTVPLAEHKKVLDYAITLEQEKLAQMDDAGKAEYFKTRAVAAEDALTSLTLKQESARLKELFPEADPEEVSGKTVSELEASFQRSQERNKKAYDRALAKSREEVAEKLKDVDASVKEQVDAIFEAWGRPRQAQPEDAKIQSEEAARKGFKEAGINLGEQRQPQGIDELIMSKVPDGLRTIFGTKK